jgi:single-stranded DNA-binding protein
MLGVNAVYLGGNLSDSAKFRETGSGKPCCSFKMACDRRGVGGDTITVWVKVNVYVEPLVELCRTRLQKGLYLVVVGELMNRDGDRGELIEVRAQQLIFAAQQVPMSPPSYPPEERR